MYFSISDKMSTWLLTLLAIFIFPVASQAFEKIDLPFEAPIKRTAALEEVWRIGADDEDVLLGLINSGILDDQGHILLADNQLSHVQMVSLQGEILDTLGREGDGPGEIRNLQSIVAFGDRVGLVQGFPGKVIYVDHQGVPAGSFRLGSGAQGDDYAFRDLRSIGTTLVGLVSKSQIDFHADTAGNRTSLSVLTADGAIETELVSHEVSRGIMTIVLDEAAEWAEFSTWALSPLGVVATLAERDHWSINERGLDGTIRRVFNRPSQSRKRTDEDKDAAMSNINLDVATGSSIIEENPLDTDPAIIDLQYAADGRLFVTSCHNAAPLLPPGLAGRYDVITPDGQLAEELTLVYEDFDPQQDVLVFLDGNLFLIIANYEDAQRAVYAAYLPEQEKEDLSDVQPLEVILVQVSQDR